MKMMRILYLFVFVILLAGFVVSAQSSFYGTSNQGSARFTTYQSADFRQYYSSSQIRDYWPILGNEREVCESRQDLLIQVSPFGCQPSVVRSDLLAEQNVPVFCQLDAIRLNPLLDIKQIRNIRFTGNYPKEISGAGFHPAQAALRTRTELLGDPLLNNIGYVVVVLRKQGNESNLPDFVNVTLKAQVDYYAGNAFGVGKTSFNLKEVSDEEWKVEKNRQSFFNGRYSVRLEDADSERARVVFYHGDVRASSLSVSKNSAGRTGEGALYLPGFYCQIGLKVIYDGLIPSETSARLQIGDDVLNVVKGESFMNGKCRVNDIESNITGDKAGRVELSCGSERFDLHLTREVLGKGDKVFVLDDNGNLNIKDGELVIDEVVKNSDGSVGYKLKKLDGADYSPDVDSRNVRSASEDKLGEARYDNKTESYFNNAIKSYRQVAEDFPAEKKSDLSERYGEESLARAIGLAEDFGKFKTASELVSLYLNTYPDSKVARGYADKLNGYYRFDSSRASAVVDLDARTQVIRLLSINEPSKKSKASFNFNGVRNDLEVGRSGSLGLAGNYTLDYVDADQVRVTGYCRDGEGKYVKENSETLYLNRGVNEKSKNVCGQVLRLENTELEEFAKVRIEPVVKGPTIETNLTVNIGIEERALKLTPDKALERMENLNKTIRQWEKVSSNLGNFVKGMKAACFATAGVLTVKNFVTGLSGEALARQQVMRGPDGWTEHCQQAVNGGEYGGSMTRCYNENSGAIGRQVSEMTRVINAENARIKGIEGQGGVKTSSTLLGESVVDGEIAKDKYISQEFGNLGGEKITLSDGKNVSVSNLIEKNGERRYLSYQEAIELKRNLEFRGAMSGSGNEVGRELADAQLQRIAQSITDRQESQKDRDSWSSLSGSNVEIIRGTDTINYNWYGQTWGDLRPKINPSPNSHTLFIPEGAEDNTPVQIVGVPEEGTIVPYMAVLRESSQNKYGATSYYKLKEENGKFSYDGWKLNSLPGEAAQNIGVFKKVDRQSCYNKIENPEVKYYETEPYKGMPAVVPFDIEEGWYVGTRQTLAAFGSIKAFQSSGRPVSFWVCNVGSDREVDFFISGFDDDICQQFNVETGAPLDKFSCLSESETRNVVNRASRALEDAARQRSDGRANSFARIEGQTIKVGAPAVNLPGTQCQDFMSAEDCKLLFNVCDPVICPSSRCNFGGKYPVADVIQSGIVGSALLCLPNINEGVLIPVCLTGIHAGIDSYLSILKSHYACLQENVETGRYTGICDEISAVYMCEFFWRQAAPLANVLLPKLVETAYGQGQARGGGEYRTVQSAWDNAQGSVNYFTQSYAVNSLEAFNIRSVEEAGTPVCRAFVSAKGPKSFESLIEPDSPPQFHAWFSAIPYSDATVPATSQYKVFYHVFAGNDQGVSYSVYLKDPPQTSYYQTSAVVHVDSGFAPRGQFATETKDFTAPSGYQQLCVRVNDQEECGFKQVSTSFALNAIRDEFVSGEINARGIKSESECVSGRVNPSAILNPNIQEAVQEGIDPAIYNRGVVRICATENPGRTTDPTRFLNVGFCGDQKVICWLDSESVDKALTAENVGLRNKTYTAIQDQVMQDLRKSDKYTFLEEQDSRLEAGRLDEGQLGEGISVEEGKGKLSVLSSVKESLVLNVDKAQVLVLEGKVYEAVARNLRGIVNPAVRVEASAQPQAQANGAGEKIVSTEGDRDRQIAEGSLSIDNQNEFTLEKISNIDAYAIMKDGKFTHYIISAPDGRGNRALFGISSDNPSDFASPNTRGDGTTTNLGPIKNNKISASSPLPKYLDSNVYSSIKGSELDFDRGTIKVVTPSDTGSSTASKSLTFEKPITISYDSLTGLLFIDNADYRFNSQIGGWEYRGARLFGWHPVSEMKGSFLNYRPLLLGISEELVGKDEMQGLEYFVQYENNIGSGKVISNFPKVDIPAYKGEEVAIIAYDVVDGTSILTTDRKDTRLKIEGPQIVFNDKKVGTLSDRRIKIDQDVFNAIKTDLRGENIEDINLRAIVSLLKKENPPASSYLYLIDNSKLYWGRLYKEASVEEESSAANNREISFVDKLSLVIEGSKNKISYKSSLNSQFQYTGLYWNYQGAEQFSNLPIFKEDNNFPVAYLDYDYNSKYYILSIIDNSNEDLSILNDAFKLANLNGLKIKRSGSSFSIFQYP